MYTCVHGWHAGRKWIDYAYALSGALHSAGCIKMGAGKWRSIHFRQDRRKIVFFRFFLKTQVSLSNCYNVSMLWDQTLTRAWVKWKICTPDQNSMTWKSVIYKKSTKMSFPPDRYSNKFLNACINHHVHGGYLKRIELYSPLGIRHVFLCSINNNKNENTYQFRCQQVSRRHFIPENRRMTYQQYA